MRDIHNAFMHYVDFERGDLAVGAALGGSADIELGQARPGCYACSN